MSTFIRSSISFIKQIALPLDMEGVRDPDVGLWAIRAIQLFLAEYPDCLLYTSFSAWEEVRPCSVT